MSSPLAAKTPRRKEEANPSSKANGLEIFTFLDSTLRRPRPDKSAEPRKKGRSASVDDKSERTSVKKRQDVQPESDKKDKHEPEWLRETKIRWISLLRKNQAAEVRAKLVEEMVNLLRGHIFEACLQHEVWNTKPQLSS